jgi:hypothetical protein
MTLNITKALLASDINGYSDEAQSRKDAFHREGERFLRAFASALGLSRADYDIRSNKGGMAVSGEVTLHADALYVQLFESAGQGVQAMYRQCQGRKDYSGGSNNFVEMSELRDIAAQDKLIAECKRLASLD